METIKPLKQPHLAFINDKSPILDMTCSDLAVSGTDILFCSESIEDGLSQLSTLEELPQVCIIDLDFYDKNVLAQLRELKKEYLNIKLIVHSDKDSEKMIKSLLEIGIDGYLFIGSGADDFKKAIEGAVNGKRYFSVGVSKIAHEYFNNK